MATKDIDRTFNEYPFLSKFMPRCDVPSVSVQDWDDAFLVSSTKSYPDSGSEKLYLVDAEGDVVGKVNGWIPWLRNGADEMVAQALDRIGDDAGRVRYAVGVWPGVSLSLHKLPEGYVDAAQWLESRRQPTPGMGR